MTTTDNKQLVQRIFAALALGDSRPLIDSFADDFCWTVQGTTRWSRTYRGKRAVLEELLRPLNALFADRYTNTAHRFIAEDEHVVVECEGRATTKAGAPYNNRYCMVIRIVDGQLRELTEYCDTELIVKSLGA